MKTYRIYINNNALIISNQLPVMNVPVQEIPVKGFNFLSFYTQLDLAGNKHYVLLTDDTKAVFKQLKSSCTLVKAAGGLVKNAKNGYLFIYRNKKWDLPKGKVEKGEGMREAGWREVEEECGVKVWKSGKKLCRTYHIYVLGNKLALKKTNWYAMTVKGIPVLIPQREEGITKAEWLSADQVGAVLENTYPSIMDVMEAGNLTADRLLQ